MLKRLAWLAFGCFALATFSLPASAQDGVDTTKLPRVEGARELYAHPAATSFATADAVPETADRVRDALLALGWKAYSNPFADYARTDRFRTMEFKKGRQSLNVSISIAPAQRGETAVSYSALVHKNDLPIPEDATDIGFAPDRPHLQLFTGGTVGRSLVFFRMELAAMGWTEWQPTDPAKVVADAAGTRAITYFTRERTEPLALVLQRMSDGRTSVHLMSVPAQTLTAIEQNPAHANAKASIGGNTPVASAGTAPHGWEKNLPASVIETATPRKQARAPESPRDVRELPRPAGAHVKDEDARKNDQHSMRYAIPLGIAAAKSTLNKLLTDDGWVAFVEPLERSDGRSLYFKNGEQRISLHFHTDGETRSGVWITSNRNQNDIPTPPGATDIVFDDRRPLLDAIAPGTVEQLLAFFRTELTARGWSEWSAADATRYPSARIESTIEGGVRAYFTRGARDRQAPIQVSLGRRADNRVDIEVKVPPFARPQQLTADWKTYGLPRPELIKSASGRGGTATKQMTATVPAELDVVLAFYRRELTARNWKEDERSTIVKDGAATLSFSSAQEGTIVVKLSTAYDLTVVDVTQRLMPDVVAARQKAVRDREEQVRRDIEARMRAAAAEAEAAARRAVAQQAAAPAKPDGPLEAEDYDGFPVPESSASKHTSSSKYRTELTATVRSELAAVLAFYRRELGKRNWKEGSQGTIAADRVTIAYLAPEGPALLTLGREGGMTTINVALRKPEEARKAGILPRPGTARIIMGNMIERQAVVTINKRAVTLRAGVGKDGPDGPSLDLPPGTYRYTVQVPGRPTASEKVTVGADQTWGLVIGPGGALALNLY
jgi:hypothetical protein